MSILGHRVMRKEDPRFLTVGGDYVDDLRVPELEGALYVTYVRSSVAHARLVSIDVSEAAAAPGVVAVYTNADLGLGPFPLDVPMLPKTFPRSWLAADVVRYVGEPVVAIVTEDRYQGPDAAELVVVDYEPLPVAVTPADAVRDEVLLHPEAGTNACFSLPAGEPDTVEREVRVRQRVINQKVAPCPLEGRTSAAAPGPDGRLWFWSAGQGVHPIRANLASGLGLDPGEIRVLTTDVGGGFGAKAFAYPEDLLLGWIARRLGRPVRWAEPRSEGMVGLGHGRAQVQDVEIAGRRDGTIEYYRVDVLQDAGAYPRMSAFLPMLTRMMLTGVYAIREVGYSATSVVTNTTPLVAYRGAGRPEAAAAIERAVDLFAAEIGMDPADVRRRNFIAPDAFPYTTATGTTYDSGRYRDALDTALATIGYEALRAEQASRRQVGAGPYLGIGMSVYVEVTAPGGGNEFADIVVRPDGRVLVRTGTTPYGQGHVTTWSMLVADKLGVPLDDIDVVFGDSDMFPTGSMTGGSRSVQIGGMAVEEASDQVLAKAKDLAASLLEADPADIVLDREHRRFHVAGTPAVARTWAELAAAADGGLDVAHNFKAQGATYPFGAHVAVVEVDPDTGKVTLVRYVSVDDAGTVINELLFEGQVHGGIAQGVAQALFEEVRYDADGNPLTANFADYAFPAASEFCSFERVRQETPSPLNRLGAKGVGEAGSIGATPAAQNAVVDALAHLGVRHVDMPCTPERVWRAIHAARG